MDWPKIVLGMGSSYIGRICDSCRVTFKFGDVVALMGMRGRRLVHADCLEEAKNGGGKGNTI